MYKPGFFYKPSKVDHMWEFIGVEHPRPAAAQRLVEPLCADAGF